HHEDRTHIFQFKQREESIDTKQALWCTDWNLFLISFIICPLYFELLEHLKLNNVSSKIDINRYLKLMPQNSSISKELEPYFKPMLKIFYTNLHKLNLIPMQDVDKREVIHWHRADQLKFTRSFEAYHSISAECDLFCGILSRAKINICRYNELIDLF